MALEKDLGGILDGVTFEWPSGCGWSQGAAVVLGIDNADPPHLVSTMIKSRRMPNRETKVCHVSSFDFRSVADTILRARHG